VALGHRRLSILDLSPHELQPMCTEDRRYWIVHNGEVYNYQEVWEEPKKEGENIFSKEPLALALGPLLCVFPSKAGFLFLTMSLWNWLAECPPT